MTPSTTHSDFSEQAKCRCRLALAIASLPSQPWEELRDPETALRCGTVFQCLDMPFFAGGEPYEL